MYNQIILPRDVKMVSSVSESSSPRFWVELDWKKFNFL